MKNSRVTLMLLAIASTGMSTMLVPMSGTSQTPTVSADRPDVDRDLDPAIYERWKAELSNWGRWGADDEIGTLNLITPAKRREAAALVTEGVSVSLAADADTVRAVDNPNPWQHEMLGIASDRLAVAYHGITHSHLDALAHINDNGVFYNGYQPDSEEVIANGHPKQSIHNVRNGIFTRGVLIDIPRLKGLPWLEPGTPIYVEDLEAWEERAGVRVGPGDALFVRTGVWARRSVEGPWLRGRAPGGRSAGLHPSVIPWLKERDIAVMGSDHPHYVSPSNLPGAVHDFALLYLGMSLFDNLDLEALAEAADEHDRWEFLLTAAPLPIRGGTGSPINPLATF
jgi:kynurenine formamidase